MADIVEEIKQTMQFKCFYERKILDIYRLGAFNPSRPKMLGVIADSKYRPYLLDILCSRTSDELVDLLAEHIPLKCEDGENNFTVIFKVEKDLLLNAGAIDCTFSNGIPNCYKLKHNDINDKFYIYDIGLNELDDMVKYYSNWGKKLCI